ncbi:hypothetical protein PP707_05905 [Acetobacter pasteurianus]|nr:hypothetical protein [Acetobacter pasteurianus]
MRSPRDSGFDVASNLRVENKMFYAPVEMTLFFKGKGCLTLLYTGSGEV